AVGRARGGRPRWALAWSRPADACRPRVRGWGRATPPSPQTPSPPLRSARRGACSTSFWHGTTSPSSRAAGRERRDRRTQSRLSMRCGSECALYATISEPGAGGALFSDPGLLTGGAGIALALLAAATPVEPAWDRLVLIDLPIEPRARVHAGRRTAA